MKIYKIDEVADLLKLSDAWVYARIADGTLPHFKLKGAIRISETQLQEYLARSEQGSSRVSVKPLKNLTLN